LRTRQIPAEDSNNGSTPRESLSDVTKANQGIPGLNNIPPYYFEPGTIGEGINKSGLLKERVKIPIEYSSEFTRKGRPLLIKPPVYSYFFLEYNNQNVKGIGGLLKSFAVVKTLNDTDLKTFSQMLGTNVKNITPISKETYDTGTFTHPKYINDNGNPLVIRYAEIAIIKQITPGRLDDCPIGYPDFDSTPDGIINIKSPIPGSPYTSFTAFGNTGATSTVGVNPGGTVQFIDKTPKTPWQTAPTGWNWSFGPSASPTGSTAQSPIVLYSMIGNYSVTLTTSNSYGSKSLTKTNFVIVNI
jgi:hypothetical protein